MPALEDMTPEELAKRRPVWVALSELWLDTKLQESDLAYIASVLKQSGYSLAELRAIHFNEVAPVVSPNLQLVAGVWDGFDEEWLCAAILRPVPQARPALLAWGRPTRARFVHSATEHHWKRLEQMLAE